MSRWPAEIRCANLSVHECKTSCLTEFRSSAPQITIRANAKKGGQKLQATSFKIVYDIMNEGYFEITEDDINRQSFVGKWVEEGEPGSIQFRNDESKMLVLHPHDRQGLSKALSYLRRFQSVAPQIATTREITTGHTVGEIQTFDGSPGMILKLGLPESQAGVCGLQNKKYNYEAESRKDTHKIHLSRPNLAHLYQMSKMQSTLFPQGRRIEPLVPENYRELWNIIEQRFPVSQTFLYCLRSTNELFLCNVVGGKDEDCKHSFLCNTFENACGAGIATFRSNEIQIDNLSGTYTTTPEQMQYLKLCLQLTFKGCIAKCIDIDNDKQFEEFCDQNNLHHPDTANICPLPPVQPIPHPSGRLT